MPGPCPVADFDAGQEFGFGSIRTNHIQQRQQSGRNFARRRWIKHNFDAALFGNILGVTNQDLVVVALVAAVTLVLVFFLYKQLLFTTFDPEVAPI